MRHPRDSEAWKTFDLLHPEFVDDPQNVRLGLATNGFNPFGNMSTSHSIWARGPHTIQSFSLGVYETNLLYPLYDNSWSTNGSERY